MNRNRHTKHEPKAVDPVLHVVRFDDLNGKPLVILMNFAAHPTNMPEELLQFSCEYPGFAVAAVKEATGANCVFMQGASGDMSPNKTQETDSIETFGRELGLKAAELAKQIETKVPEKPSIQVTEDEFKFESRIPLGNPMLIGIFQTAFFPELVSALDEIDGTTISSPMLTALINGQLAIVTGPGEFFCNHAVRLRERSWADDTLFFGYCNGHNMYYPTIEATAEGGYGADAMVSWVELGAGERMMDKALININTMLGKYPPVMATMMNAK
jgi:hypothetical protein